LKNHIAGLLYRNHLKVFLSGAGFFQDAALAGPAHSHKGAFEPAQRISILLLNGRAVA
jgi:hypothetical protein